MKATSFFILCILTILSCNNKSDEKYAMAIALDSSIDKAIKVIDNEIARSFKSLREKMIDPCSEESGTIMDSIANIVRKGFFTPTKSFNLLREKLLNSNNSKVIQNDFDIAFQNVRTLKSILAKTDDNTSKEFEEMIEKIPESFKASLPTKSSLSLSDLSNAEVLRLIDKQLLDLKMLEQAIIHFCDMRAGCIEDFYTKCSVTAAAESLTIQIGEKLKVNVLVSGLQYNGLKIYVNNVLIKMNHDGIATYQSIPAKAIGEFSVPVKVIGYDGYTKKAQQIEQKIVYKVIAPCK